MLRYAIILAVGILVGWLVFGWALFPVEYSAVYPDELRPEVREEYLLMTADSYILTRDIERAAARLRYWQPEEIGPIIYRLAEDRERIGRLDTASRLRELAGQLRLPSTAQLATPTPVARPAATGAPTWLYALLFLGLLTALVLVVMMWRKNVPIFGRLTPARRSRIGEVAETILPEDEEDEYLDEEDDEDWEEELDEEFEEIELDEALDQHEDREDEEGFPQRGYAAQAAVEETRAEREKPLRAETEPGRRAQDVAHRVVFSGDPDFNEMFAIGESQDYVGEFGVGVGELAPDNPRHVLSMEVWLFDKSDIRTEVVVLMPPATYEDESVRMRLAGEDSKALPLEPGMEIDMVTQRLRVRGRVRAAQFGSITDLGPTIRYVDMELIGSKRED